MAKGARHVLLPVFARCNPGDVTIKNHPTPRAHATLIGGAITRSGGLVRLDPSGAVHDEREDADLLSPDRFVP